MNEDDAHDPTEAMASVEQVEIPFLDDLLLAARASDGDVYVPIVPFCIHLGIGYPRGQVARIRSDETLRDGLRLLAITTSGGRQRLQALRVDMLTLWLAGVQENVVKESVRPILSRYKREAARVILEHFTRRAQMHSAGTPLPTPAPGAALTEWRAWHLAMADIYTTLEAQRATQIQHAARLDGHDTEIAAISDDLIGIKEALAIIGEAPVPRISPHQASEIQQLVGKIHEATGLHQKTIYGAFNKQWRIPRYDELPANDFDAALAWLRQWGRARLPR